MICAWAIQREVLLHRGDGVGKALQLWKLQEQLLLELYPCFLIFSKRPLSWHTMHGAPRGVRDRRGKENKKKKRQANTTSNISSVLYSIHPWRQEVQLHYDRLRTEIVAGPLPVFVVIVIFVLRFEKIDEKNINYIFLQLKFETRTKL